MYISRSSSKHSSGKEYHSILLRQSYREGNKVKKRTIANLSNCREEEIKQIENALKSKMTPNISGNDSFKIVQGRSIGSVYVLYKVAERLGIVSALGNSFHGKLALWLIISRIIEQGSRLSAT